MKLLTSTSPPDKHYSAISRRFGSVEGRSSSQSPSPSRSDLLYEKFNNDKKQFFASMGKKSSPFKVSTYSPSAVQDSDSISSSLINEEVTNNISGSSLDGVFGS